MSDSSKILQQHLDRLGSILNESPAGAEQLRLFCASLAETGEQAMSAGFPGLLDICLIFHDCLANWQPDAGAEAMDMSVLATWPEAVRDYILTPESDTCKDALIQLLRYPAWGTAITNDDAVMLKGLLDIHINTDGARSASTELSLEELPEPESTPPSAKTGPTAQDLHINSTLPAQLRELISIMIMELLNIKTSIQHVQSLLQPRKPDKKLLKQSWHGVSQTLGFYCEAVTSIDFKGLGAIVNHVRDNLQGIDVNDRKRVSPLLDLLLEWTGAVQLYLEDPVNTGAANALLNLMQSTRWPQYLSDEQTSAITVLFQTLSSSATAVHKKPQRQQIAGPDDVSLTLPEDVDQDLLEAMLQELPAQTEALTTALQRLNNGSGPDDILVAKRIAHTLKGAGNTVGIRGIATLTHNLEDILLELHKQEVLPSPRIMQTLMNATDCLAVMSESLLGTGEPPEDAQAVLQEVLDMANMIDIQGIAALNSADSGLAPVFSTPGNDHSGNITANKTDSGEREMIPMLRLPAAFIDNLLRLIGENKIMTGQINNFTQETLRQMKDMRSCFDQLRSLGSKVQELTDIKDLTQVKRNMQKSPYDILEMDHYSELHTYSKWLSEATVDAHEISRAITANLVRLQDMLAVQSRLNNETQDNVIHARMLPVETHLQRLQRCVRQAVKLTGKPVELHLEGGETLLDSETLNALLDPLMHLLRNAVDHGIENQGERIALGKPETGNITLSFARDGNNILVYCRDDGKGLDLNAIRQKAISQGLLQEDQQISDTELKQFILRPNFSTKKETTQVSGRGIGMDAVQASISALSGILSIDSEPGKGSTIRIRLPQNSLSLFALLVRTGPRRLVIANRDIARIVHNENGKLIKTNDDELTFQLEGENYPALPIEKLLNIFPDRRAEERLSRTAILYGNESGTTAVMVEKILGSGDFVVKGLGDYVPNIPGILGVTLLGDGMVAPVLDIAELLRHSQSLFAESTRYSREDFTPAKLPTALVVDDSLSARRSLVQFMRDAGYEVRQARDGMEAMDIILAHKPDLLLSDLEMPRMNGMELTGHIRANTNTMNLPIIMITSRAAAKHREEALATGVNVYLTKPYAEDELLEEIRKLVL